MFHVTLLICAYFFETVSYYFCVSGIESTRNWRIVLFCVEVFGFLKIFISCASLSLNLVSLLERLSPGKKPHRKNDYSTFCISVIPPMKINPQH